MEFLNRWVGGEWPRSSSRLCNNDEADLGVGAVAVAVAVTVAAAGLVKRVRWRPAASSKLRAQVWAWAWAWARAAARQVAWNCKQVTPETGIEVPEGQEMGEPRMACVCLFYLLYPYLLTAGAGGLGRYWSQQRGRNQNSNGQGVFRRRRQAGRWEAEAGRYVGRQAGRQAGSSVDE